MNIDTRKKGSEWYSYSNQRAGVPCMHLVADDTDVASSSSEPLHSSTIVTQAVLGPSVAKSSELPTSRVDHDRSQ